MLRNKMIRAAIPKGSPISFVDATQGTGGGGSTGTITVSTDDFVLLFSHGKIAEDPSIYSYGGTSSLGSLTNIIAQGATTGSSGNDYLNIASSAPVSSGGTLNMTESGGREAGYGILAVDGGANTSVDAATSGSISVSSVTTDDVVVIYETTQTLSTGTGSIPSTPSGFTSAFSQSFTTGKGGGTQGWACRVSYKTGASGTVAHTVTTAGDFNGGAIIRIYN